MEIYKYFVTLVHFDDDGNFYVDNFEADNEKDAKNIIEQEIKLIKDAYGK